MIKNRGLKFLKAAFSAFLCFNLFASLAFAQPQAVSKKRLPVYKSRYKAARQQYLKEINYYKNSRQQFLSARAKYKKFRNAKNKAAYEKQARAFLERTVNVLARRLESLKTWVSNRRAISAEEKQAIVSEIEKDINWLNSKKAGIATASGTQIREKAKEVRQYWRKHRIFVKRIIGRIWAARISWVIKRFEVVASKVQKRINALKAQGKDTSQLENWLNDFNQKIDLAKKKIVLAKEKYQAISSLKDANQFFRASHNFIKEANFYLRQAHRDLVKIIREMRKMAARKKLPSSDKMNSSKATSSSQ